MTTGGSTLSLSSSSVTVATGKSRLDMSFMPLIRSHLYADFGKSLPDSETNVYRV